MSKEGLVSVLIPAYNAAEHLPEAVRSAQEQSYRELEITIINDGSTDDTAAIANDFQQQDPRVKVVHQANGGLSSARNAGLSVAEGEFICLLDADDAYLPNKIADQLAFLRQHEHLDLVYSDVYQSVDNLKPARLVEYGLPPLPFHELYVYRNWFVPIAPLMRASLVHRVGEFDTSLNAAEDWDYWTRCARVGTFGYLPGAVAIYRLHPGQMHHQFERMREAQFKVLHKHYHTGGKQRRAFLGARHWDYARRFKFNKQYVKMLKELALFTLVTRNIREIKQIMNLVT